ncbi:MAG: HAMP domain-containing protein, partial [bacterium]|nr:HAMP domain-containing protein [bacterium]
MRITIFAKLALTFLVIVAGLVLFLSVSAARELDQSFTDLVRDRQDQVARGIDVEVGALLSEIEGKLTGMRDNPDFRLSLSELERVRSEISTTPNPEEDSSAHTAENAQVQELIARVEELRDIAFLSRLWLISPDGILLAAGHDEYAFGNNLLDPPGTYSSSLEKALTGETVSMVGVETISANSIFTAEVFLPVKLVDRFLGTEQIYVLWGAEDFDDAFIKRMSNLADAELVTRAPGLDPIVSWSEPGTPVDPGLLDALSRGVGEISLNGETYQLATLTFPRSISDSTHEQVMIDLLIPKSDLQARKRTLLAGMLVEVIIGGIVTILLAFLIAKSITLPIERLKIGVTALASGDITRRVEVHSRDEVEDLVKSFNMMADDLDTNTRRLVEAEKLSAWREVARRLAHEIKNPLSPIKLSIQNLSRVDKGNPKAFEKTLTETSETILEEVDRLKTLADEFSNFARMPKPILTPNDISELVGGSVALFDKPEIGASIELTCPNNVPSVLLDRDA